MTKLEKIIYDASYEYERKVFDKGTLSDERERAKIIAATVLPLIEGFAEWHDSLSPSQKCTVWPPAGSGAGTGLYDKSKKDLFKEYLSELSGNNEQLKDSVKPVIIINEEISRDK